MEQVVDQVASLMDDSEIEEEIEDESDSDIEEDPTFPLPTPHSDDEGDTGPLSRDTASHTTHTPPPHSPTLSQTNLSNYGEKAWSILARDPCHNYMPA